MLGLLSVCPSRFDFLGKTNNCIGLNATRIDRIKQKTGAYVYINGETSDLKRTVIIKGTRGQVDRAYAWIENLIERHKTNKLPIKPQRSYVKRKEK
jgi:hypothetical protein